VMLKIASFLTEVPEWTQPPKPPQDGTDLIYYKSIVICLFGLFQETSILLTFSGTLFTSDNSILISGTIEGGPTQVQSIVGAGTWLRS